MLNFVISNGLTHEPREILLWFSLFLQRCMKAGLPVLGKINLNQLIYIKVGITDVSQWYLKIVWGLITAQICENKSKKDQTQRPQAEFTYEQPSALSVSYFWMIKTQQHVKYRHFIWPEFLYHSLRTPGKQIAFVCTYDVILTSPEH